MKNKLWYILLTASIFSACTPSTYITGSWKSPSMPKQYTSILVAALTNNTIARATLENDLARELGKTVHTVKSIDEFPPNITGSDSTKAMIMEKVKNKNADAILTISILKQETESRYIPGRVAYDPWSHSYYDDFWGYYSYWYPQFYSPSMYYAEDKIYYIETNLYDTSDQKLVWSAQSNTYSPDELKSFSTEFATTIVAKLKADGVLSRAITEK